MRTALVLTLACGASAAGAAQWLPVPAGFGQVDAILGLPSDPVVHGADGARDLSLTLDLSRVNSQRECPPGIWRGRAEFPHHAGGTVTYTGTLLGCFPWGVGVARYPDGSLWRGMVQSYLRHGAPSYQTDSVRMAVPMGTGALVSAEGAVTSGLFEAGRFLGSDTSVLANQPRLLEFLANVMRLAQRMDGGDGNSALGALVNANPVGSQTPYSGPSSSSLGAPLALPNDAPRLLPDPPTARQPPRGPSLSLPPVGSDERTGTGRGNGRGGAIAVDSGPTQADLERLGGPSAPLRPPTIAGPVVARVPTLGPAPTPLSRPTSTPWSAPQTMPTASAPVSVPAASTAPVTGPTACLRGRWTRAICGGAHTAEVWFSGSNPGKGGFKDADCAQVCPQGRGFDFDYRSNGDGTLAITYTGGQICGQPVTPRGGNQPFTCNGDALKFGNDYRRAN